MSDGAIQGGTIIAVVVSTMASRAGRRLVLMAGATVAQQLLRFIDEGAAKDFGEIRKHLVRTSKADTQATERTQRMKGAIDTANRLALAAPSQTEGKAPLSAVKQAEEDLRASIDVINQRGGGVYLKREELEAIAAQQEPAPLAAAPTPEGPAQSKDTKPPIAQIRDLGMEMVINDGGGQAPMDDTAEMNAITLEKFYQTQPAPSASRQEPDATRPWHENAGQA